MQVLFDVKMWDSEKSCRGHPHNETALEIILNDIKKSRIPHDKVRKGQLD
jgi:hypothetical protein